MINKYLLILGIGHLLGDFYFQNDKMAKWKEQKYKGVLGHSLEYYAAVFVVILPVFSIDMIWAVTCAALLHFVIDSVKYILLKKKKSGKSCKTFVIDQCFHGVSLLILAYFMNYRKFSLGHLEIVEKILSEFGCNAMVLAQWILAILFIHVPVNIFIQNALGDYKPKSDETIIKVDNKAGRRIGTVERLIMLLFLSLNQYSALGFVLTAKSIARYDKITKDEKFAEYYLLGTLISTLCVILCKLFVLP